VRVGRVCLDDRVQPCQHGSEVAPLDVAQKGVNVSVLRLNRRLPLGEPSLSAPGDVCSGLVHQPVPPVGCVPPSQADHLLSGCRVWWAPWVAARPDRAGPGCGGRAIWAVASW
jgi:hypothetical protein